MGDKQADRKERNKALWVVNCGGKVGTRSANSFYFYYFYVKLHFLFLLQEKCIQILLHTYKLNIKHKKTKRKWCQIVWKSLLYRILLWESVIPQQLDDTNILQWFCFFLKKAYILRQISFFTFAKLTWSIKFVFKFCSYLRFQHIIYL